ncbi:hypothetical protein ETI10_01760 [Macrococcoides goetzii]|nr:hypothetical protein [Macrococcus goetzii]TDM41837.1 hypothetical protein ETI10_01760 [Macrococcus goetzii]
MNKNFAVNITANINKFLANISKAQSAARRLDDKVTVNVTADTSAATAQISRFRLMLKSIPNKFRVRGDVDTATALGKVRLLKSQMAVLFSKATKIRIELDENGAIAKLGVLKAAMLALSPAAIPVLASIVPAVMAIGNALAVVGGGVIGLAGAFAIAGTGAMAFGAMAMTAYKMLQDGTLQATAQTRAFQTALTSLQTQWQSLVQANSGAIFTTMTNGINIAKTALSGLTPFITGVANSMSTLSTKMLSFFQSSSIANNFFAMFNTIGVQAFNNVMNAVGRFGAGFMAIITQFGPLFSWMAQGLANMSAQFQAWATSVSTANGIKTFISYVQTNLPLIGQIFGNVFQGIFNLFTAFGTNSQTIFQSLAEMSARFAQWSATIAQSQGFKQFIDYVQTNGPVIMSTIGNIVTAVMAFATAMAPVGAAVLSVVSSIAQWVAGFMTANPAITQVVGSIVLFGGAIMKAIAFMTPFISAIMRIGSFVIQLVSKFNLVRTAITVLSAVFGTLSAPMLAVIAAVVAVGAALYLLWTKCETFRNGVMILIGVMQTLGSAIMSGLGTALSFIGQQLAMVVASVIAFGSQLVSSIGSAMSGLGSAISSGISSAVSFVSSGFSNMLSVASSIMSSISSTVSSIWSSIVSTCSSLISSAVSAVSSGFSNMLSTASSIMSSILSAVSSAFSSVVSAISSGISSAVSAVSSGFSSMMSAVSSFVSGLISAISSGMSSFVSAISSGASSALSAITSMVSGILGAIRGAAGQMVSAGADLVRGFINGIKSMAGAALSAAKSMAANAVNAVKSMLKIGSPSKVLKQIGQWLTQGFALGIRKDIPKVESAIQRMLRPVTRGLAKLKTKDYENSREGASSVYSLMVKNIENATKQIEEAAKKRKSLGDKIAKINKSLTGKMSIKARNIKMVNLSKLRKQYTQLNQIISGQYAKRAKNRNLIKEVRPMLVYMTRIAKKRESIAKQLEKAQDKLQAAIDKKMDFRNAIRNDLRGYASIMNTGRKTSQGMVKMMTKRLDEIKKYQALIGSLKKRGLNKDTLKEILDAGIEQGSVIAKGLFVGGQNAIKQVNILQSQINKASANMGDANAKHFYQAGVDAARGIVNGLKSQEKYLKTVATKIADVISSTIKKRLKIKSPSRVMLGLMSYVGAGLVNGLTATISKVIGVTTKISDAIEDNINPQVGLDDLKMGSDIQAMNSQIKSDLALDSHNTEDNKQDIVIVLKSDTDLPAVKTYIERTQGINSGVRVMRKA